MKKSIFSLAIAVLITMNSFPQSFSDFIDYLNSLPEDQRMAAVDSFMIAAEPQGFPYITGDSANFIYRGNVASIRIAGDFNGWDPGFYFLANVTGTDFYHRSTTFEMNARLDYKYVTNDGAWILDPLNPNTCTGGYGPNSELAMPDYVHPWEIESYPGVPLGTIITDQIASTFTNSTFQLKIYLPNGYDENLPGGYPVVYFQDGYEYISLGFADKVLDNLIDSNLCSPVIGVFVKPNNRNDEYAGNLRNAYQQFFVEELVPYIDGEYNTMTQARARAVIGDSFGGNISALIAYNHADLFGNCGLHSGAFWPNDFEAFYLITEGEIKPIRWASVWGTYEGLWENMRAFKDFLMDNDYDLHWQELPEGHSWGLWLATIDEMVPYFFPPEFMGTGELMQGELEEIIIYPNPVNDKVNLTLDIKAPSSLIIQLLTARGELISETTTDVPAGRQIFKYDVSQLSSGIYYLNIHHGISNSVGKIIVLE